MATARFDMRLDEMIKAKAEKAAILRGKRSLKEYIVSLMEEDATKVIAEHEGVIIEDDINMVMFFRCFTAGDQFEATRHPQMYYDSTTCCI